MIQLFQLILIALAFGFGFFSLALAALASGAVSAICAAFSAVLLIGSIGFLVYRVRKDETFTTEWAIAHGFIIVVAFLSAWVALENLF